jgi:hypothetical protein
VLVEMASRLRLIISVTLLRRSVAVTVEAEQLMPIPERV